MPIQEEFNCFEPKCWLVTILRPVAEAGRQKITAQEEIARAFEKATAVRGSGTRGSGPYATVCIPERLGMAWPLGRGRNVRDGTFPDFSAGILITMAGVVPAGWSTATPGRWWSTSVFNQNGRHVRCVSAIRQRRNSMKRTWWVAWVSVLIFAFAVAAWGQAAATPRKKRIAIMDFDYATVHAGVSQIFGQDIDIGKGIADLLVTDLVKDGSYSIIERKAMDKILAEQNFSNSDRANPASAARIGKLLGVDAILVGSITQFGNETKNIGLGGM